MTQPNIYLDYAAATPMDGAVAKAMDPYLSSQFYNPSATYLAARQVRNDLQAARQLIASHLGAKPGEIIFTAGATEANNLAISGIMTQYPGGEVLVSAVEHDSVLQPAKLYEHKILSVDKQGRLELGKLSNSISSKSVLISVMLVNNELGTIQPLADIAHVIADIKRKRHAKGNKLPLLLHTDAAQAGNYLNLQTSRLGVDMMSINGGKLYGPKQNGALMVKAGVILSPQIIGGGQEFGMRSGTENVAGSIGLAKALDIAQKLRLQENARLTSLREGFIKSIISQVPIANLNGALRSAPHIVSMSFAGQDNERLMMELDERGIMCAVGSACSASNSDPSRVLTAIGLTDEQTRASLRFSFGRQTNKAQLDKTLKSLVQLLA